MKSLIIKLAGFAIIGGVSVGGIYYLARKQESKNNREYLTKLGLKITDYDDPIWEEGFKQYQKAYQLAEEKDKSNSSLAKVAITSKEELRDKCMEYLNAKPSDYHYASEMGFNGWNTGDPNYEEDYYLREIMYPESTVFTLNFCTWRTTLKDLINPTTKKIDFESNPEDLLWVRHMAVWGNNFRWPSYNGGVSPLRSGYPIPHSLFKKLLKREIKEVRALLPRSVPIKTNLRELKDFCRAINLDMQHHEFGVFDVKYLVSEIKDYCTTSSIFFDKKTYNLDEAKRSFERAKENDRRYLP